MSKLTKAEEQGVWRIKNSVSSNTKACDIGDVIRILRTASGMSSKELAKQSGVSTPLMSLIEKGERVPDTPLLCKIAHVLRVSLLAVHLLLDNSDEKSKDPNVNQIVRTVREIIKREKQLCELIKSGEKYKRSSGSVL